jgi:hypothetical protein
MNLKITISNAFLRKVFCITLVLFFSLNFLAGAALAKSCDGGADCMICDEAMHPHRPGMDMAAAPHGCQPLEQKDACSFEISSGLDKLHGIIPAVRTDQNEAGGSFGALAVDKSPAQSAGKFLPQLHFSDTQPTTPIYLIIQSLLC